jgi:NAD(P)-dependent dehydrogenase (short-subunit alcohol dehydrogenase family)
MSSVTDKVVFITGGARGVGAEVARRLHAKGAKLVPDLMPRMDAEVAALGRSMSARTDALEKKQIN